MAYNVPFFYKKKSLLDIINTLWYKIFSRLSINVNTLICKGVLEDPNLANNSFIKKTIYVGFS